MKPFCVACVVGSSVLSAAAPAFAQAPLPTPSAAHPWVQGAPFPEPSEAVLGAAGAGVVNGKIYVTGGVNSLPGVTENGIHPARAQNVVATVEEYDPAANSWKAVRPLLLARNHPVAIGAGDKVYAIGGRVGSGFSSNASHNI